MQTEPISKITNEKKDKALENLHLILLSLYFFSYAEKNTCGGLVLDIEKIGLI